MTQKILSQADTFPVANGFAPVELSKAISAVFDFTNTSYYDVDFTQIQQSGAVAFIQSIYVDNTGNANALTFVFDITNQRVVVPAGAQGIWPVIAPVSAKCRVSTTQAAVTCKAQFLNVPMPLTQWGPVTVNVQNVNASFTPVQKNATSTQVAMTGASVPLLAANAARTRVIIQNHPNNANPIAINFNAAAVLATGFILMPGEKYDSATGPVDARAINAIGTNLDLVNILEQ